jgi:uncharacterized protein YcgL (UPF0745 family)
MTLIVDIYRSSKKEGLYLYVKKDTDLADMPQAVMEQFGSPERAMTIMISENKKLANAEAKDVLQAIEEKGLYIQLPPPVI